MIASQLRSIGFSPYEAELYLALLQEHPSNGSQLARRSGVPRSMAYQALDRLVERGAILVAPGDPALYTPVPPAEYLGRLKSTYSTMCESLVANLPLAQGEDSRGLVWNLSGQDAIRAHADTLVQKAGPRLLVGGDPQILSRYLDYPLLTSARRPLTLGTAALVDPNNSALLIWMPTDTTAAAVFSRQPAVVASAVALARQQPALRTERRSTVPQTSMPW